MSLTWQHYRDDVLQLVSAVLQAIDPATAVRDCLQCDGRFLAVTHPTLHQEYDLTRGRVFLVAVGKAAWHMGAEVAAQLGTHLTAGLIISKTIPADDHVNHADERLTVLEAGHPVPTPASQAAATAVFDLLSQTTPDDLVIFCISGGASALLTQPIIPLEAWQALVSALLESGCSINELNAVRRPLDRVKGGGLALAAAPAHCLSLILSDVVGNDLTTIGSAPTVWVESAPATAVAVLERYRVLEHLPTAVAEQITAALHAPPDTEPSPDATPIVTNLIISDVNRAAQAAFTRAARLGFLTQILTTHLEGEAREVGKFAAAIAKDLPPGHAMILGGETTVTVRGTGRGGRNQELALAAAVALEDWPNVVVATLATDGEDATTGMAGAIVTGETVGNGRRHQLDPHQHLRHNDATTYFETLGGHLIQTGSTGTNVNDLVFILSYPTTLSLDEEE